MRLKLFKVNGCPVQNVIKSINVCSPGEKSVFHVSFPSSADTLRSHCFSDALSGLLGFFSSPHTALLLPSSGCHPPTHTLLLPTHKHPDCNLSRFLTAAPWALPSSAHQTAELPACFALNLLTLSALLSSQTSETTPLCGQRVTSAAHLCHCIGALSLYTAQ